MTALPDGRPLVPRPGSAASPELGLAGGGLAASLLPCAGTAQLRAPAGGVLFSPWAGLRNSAASFTDCANTGALSSRDAAGEAGDLYPAGHSPHDSPVSPAPVDWAGRPPVLIHSSVPETARSLRDAGTFIARVTGRRGDGCRLT